MSEIHGVGILHEDLVLTFLTSLCPCKIHLKLQGSNPFLGLHYENLHTWNLTHKTSTVLSTNAEHILCQLLRNGRSSTTATACCSILCSTYKSKGIHTPMLIETLILRAYECLPEYRCNVLILHRNTVLIEILSEKNTIRRIQFRCLCCTMLPNIRPARRLSEKPEEIKVNSSEIEHEEHNQSTKNAYGLDIPGTPFVNRLVPSPETRSHLTDEFPSTT